MGLVFRYIVVFFPLLFLAGCYNDNSKKEHKNTELIGNDIYCETYRVFGGGVYGGDVYSEYLTDSISFRYFVGSYDDDNNLAYTLEGDTIEIKHVSYDTKDGSVIISKVEKLSRADIAYHSKSQKINRE